MAALRLAALALALLACGAQGRSFRIIGEPTDISGAPWLAQLEYAFPTLPKDFCNPKSCAGSIIDSTHVLTAAHCFDKEEVARGSELLVRVRVGSTDKNMGGQTYGVKVIDVHPIAREELSASVNEMYDLAVITLDEPIVFSESVQPIELATTAVPGRAVATGGGWGSRPDKSFSWSLETFTMTKIRQEFCQGLLASGLGSEESSRALICLKPLNGMPCGGDSGSGVWMPAKDGQPARLFGVLHGGTACDTNRGLAMYADVLHEGVRDFLGQYVDMTGREAVKSYED